MSTRTTIHAHCTPVHPRTWHHAHPTESERSRGAADAWRHHVVLPRLHHWVHRVQHHWHTCLSRVRPQSISACHHHTPSSLSTLIRPHNRHDPPLSPSSQSQLNAHNATSRSSDTERECGIGRIVRAVLYLYERLSIGRLVSCGDTSGVEVGEKGTEGVDGARTTRLRSSSQIVC